MFLPADVCMPNNQDFPDLFETSGRFSVDQIYWIHFLEIPMFFETVIEKQTSKQKNPCHLHSCCIIQCIRILFY